MRALVTGAAGFIGSHLSDSLLSSGSEVIGVDCMTDYYPSNFKRRNLDYLSGRGGWRYLEKRVSAISQADLEDVDVIFHLAAQPGVRTSWQEFDSYVDLNLVETGRLAESVVRAQVPTVVFASSSSVYGDLARYPARETDVTRPKSPYGVTKLAAEKLWDAYVFAHPMRVAALRFFTVYGPGQRPDMATQRLVRAALERRTFTLFGDGEQRRDFTFVADIVNACTAVANCPELRDDCVTVLNVGGTGDVSMLQLVDLVERAAGKPIEIDWAPTPPGDVRRTGADVSAIESITGWKPTTPIEQGVRLHVTYEQQPNLENWRSVS